MERTDVLKEIKISISSQRTLSLYAFSMSVIFKFLFKVPISDLSVISQIVWFFGSFLVWKAIEKQKTARGINLALFSWFAFEVVALTVILNAWGGTTWVGVIFYTYMCIYGLFLLPKEGGLTLVSLAMFCYGAMAFLEYFEVIPHHPFITADNPHLNLFYVTITVLFMFGFFQNLFFATNLFARRLKDKMERLSQMKDELEEAKTVLEIKVKARTWELEDLNLSLDQKIKERTKELQDRLEEMEQMHKYMVGRELRMVELKKKIEEVDGNQINN